MGGFASCASEEDDVLARRPSSGAAARPAAADGSGRQQQPQQARTRQPEPQQHTALQSQQPPRIAIRERDRPPAAALLIPPSQRALQLQSSPVSERDPYAVARLCVSATPQGKLAESYKYYCPICMNHFQRIQQSECCGGYICVPCCLAHIGRQWKIKRCTHAESVARAS